MTPAALLLHGFTHTGSSWNPVVAALGESYRVLTPDIRGHGVAADTVPVSLEAVIEDLRSLSLDDEIVLVGYSMGGRVALHAALAMPERVRRLVLVGASPGIADPGEREARRRADEQLADEIERSSIEQFAGRWARTPVLAGLPAAVLVQVHADRLRNTTSGLARALRGLGSGALPSLWHRLGELRMPVSLVVGERDEKFTAIAREMKGAIDEAELTVVPGTGHAVHLEAPELLARVIASSW